MKKLLLIVFVFGSCFSFYWFQIRNTNNIELSDIEFICPENYKDSKTANEGLAKFIKDYTNKNPQATLDDLTKYRYLLLVANNCQKTLDNIKSQSVSSDQSDSYTKNVELNIAN